MTDTNPCFFPLPYDGSAVHAQSWTAGDALKGRKVIVTDRDGRSVKGIVERVETGCDRSRRFHGVSLTLRCGSERFPYSVPVGADFRAVEVLRSPDYIRV